MRSESMQKVLDRLVAKLGESTGRIKFMWLCQCYGVMPWEDAPEAMLCQCLTTKWV